MCGVKIMFYYARRAHTASDIVCGLLWTPQDYSMEAKLKWAIVHARNHVKVKESYINACDCFSRKTPAAALRCVRMQTRVHVIFSDRAVLVHAASKHART